MLRLMSWCWQWILYNICLVLYLLMTLADWDILMILLWPYLSCTASTKKMKKKMCMMSNWESGIDEKNGRFMSLKYCKVHVFHEKKQKSMRLLYFTPFLFITSNCVRTRLLSCKIAWGIYQNLESYTLRNSMVMIMGFFARLVGTF